MSEGNDSKQELDLIYKKFNDLNTTLLNFLSNRGTSLLETPVKIKFLQDMELQLNKIETEAWTYFDQHGFNNDSSTKILTEIQHNFTVISDNIHKLDPNNTIVLLSIKNTIQQEVEPLISEMRSSKYSNLLLEDKLKFLRNTKDTLQIQTDRLMELRKYTSTRHNELFKELLLQTLNIELEVKKELFLLEELAEQESKQSEKISFAPAPPKGKGKSNKPSGEQKNKSTVPPTIHQLKEKLQELNKPKLHGIQKRLLPPRNNPTIPLLPPSFAGENLRNPDSVPKVPVVPADKPKHPPAPRQCGVKK